MGGVIDAFAAFVAIGSVTVAAPVLVYLTVGERVRPASND